MADEDPLRLSSTPSSRSSLSSGSEEVQSSSVDPAGNTSPRKANSGFQCKLCTLVASSQSALDEHMNIHTGSRPYQCLECGFSCSLQSTLSQHIAVHRVEMSSSVLMRSPSVEEMQKSPRDQPPSLYPEVPRTLSLPSTAPPTMIHSEELIPVPAPVGVFPDQSRIFQCKLCTHISPTKTHLNEHMNIHSGKKPYKCLVCGFSSAFRSSLMRHLIVHTGTSKQFKCDQCHYQTPYKCNLQAHRRKRHNSVENTEIPETTVATSLPEISKVSTPNSNHSDDSQSGVGIYPPSEMSSVGFPFSQPGHAMGNSDRDNLSNGPSEERNDEAQENTTSGTTEIAGNENGYSNSSSAQPLQVSVTMDDSSVTKSSPGSGTTPTLEHTYGADNSLSSPVTENGEVTDSALIAGGISSHEPTSTSASPIASLSQMATSHSPLVQPSGNENLPVTSIWPSSAGFPIFIKKKREGAKKRKRPPHPKRDFVMSPEQEMWIDTRSETKGQVAENQRAYYFNLPGGANLKSEEDHVVYHDQNGLDLSTVAVAREGVRSASAEGQLNNHNSPVGISSIPQEDGDDKGVYPFQVYNQVGIPGRPQARISTGTQTDQSVLKEKADSNIGFDIPPQASKCPHCETYFTDTVMFTLHMSCHGRIHPFQCGICGYMCGDKIEFTCHITRSKHLR